MARRGRIAEVAPALWPFRTLRRYQRRSPVRVLGRDHFDTSWDKAFLFETHWPGDLTIWAGSDGPQYLHVTLATHGISRDVVGEAIVEIDRLLTNDEFAAPSSPDQ
jgi:hypothetical protein